MTRLRRALVALVALSPVVLSACGDSAPTADEGYCAAWESVNRSDAGAHGEDPAAVTDPDIMEKTWAESVAVAEKLLANAPDGILDDLTVVVDNLRAQDKVMADNGYDITAMAKDPEVRARMDELTGDAAVAKAKANYVSFSDDACDTNYGSS